MTRWHEYFQTILNRPNPEAIIHIPEADEDLGISLGPITIADTVIAAQKSGKVPGHNGITPEMIKAENTQTPKQAV